jgi:hypothetical protein
MSEKPIATYTMLPATSEQIAESRQTAERLLAVVEKWQITTKEDENQAAQLMTGAHGRWKELETLRKQVVTPAVNAQRTINAHFKPALDAWKKAKSLAQQKMGEAVRVREEANRARIAAAAEGNAAALAQVTQIAPPPGVSYREETKIEIEDFDQIPREYLSVDWSKLKIMAREGKAAPPGVKFVRQPRVVPTGRT